jgi:deazaflavin-dependent oxidoreductase (nitroreductase family)
MTLPDGFAEEPFAYLTTTGRVTGKPHEIEIWFAFEGDTVYLMNGDSKHPAGSGDWVRNLKKQPAVSIRIREQTLAATARIVTDAEEDALVRRLLVEKYATAANPLETWRQIAVPVALDLT